MSTAGRIKRKIPGTHYVGKWKSRKSVPVYDVVSLIGLNRIIAYFKHRYNDSLILYRGQCELYDSLSPNLYRKYDKDKETVLDENLRRMRNDADLRKYMEWPEEVLNNEEYLSDVYESLLQHYGAKTRCLDFVDNHWVALWFALNQYDKEQNCYVERVESRVDPSELIDFDPYYEKNYEESKGKDGLINELESMGIDEKTLIELFLKLDRVDANTVLDKEDVFQFIESHKNTKYDDMVNIVTNYKKEQFSDRNERSCGYLILYRTERRLVELRGVNICKNSCYYDLRKTLTDKFVRPIAQHGWVVKGKRSSYDMTSDVVCVLRIGVGLMKKMLGDGDLVSQSNFFPLLDDGYIKLMNKQKSNDYTGKDAYLPSGTIQVLKR